MREDKSRGKKRLRRNSFLCSRLSKKNLPYVFYSFAACYIVNLTPINYMLHYKSFSVFKVIHIFFYIFFAMLLFDFVIADLDFLMFLHEIWRDFFFLPKRYMGNISCMTNILTIFGLSNGS